MDFSKELDCRMSKPTDRASAVPCFPSWHSRTFHSLDLLCLPTHSHYSVQECRVRCRNAAQWRTLATECVCCLSPRRLQQLQQFHQCQQSQLKITDLSDRRQTYPVIKNQNLAVHVVHHVQIYSDQSSFRCYCFYRGEQHLLSIMCDRHTVLTRIIH